MTKETVQKDISTKEPEKFTTIKRVRTQPRRYDQDTGPLSHILDLKLPGYYLYLAVENDPNRPFEVQRLLQADIAYDFVHPLEVNAVEQDGKPMQGDKVRVPLKGGFMGVLLKLPIEYREADLNAERERNNAGLHADKSNLSGTQNLVNPNTGRLEAHTASITFDQSTFKIEK